MGSMAVASARATSLGRALGTSLGRALVLAATSASCLYLDSVNQRPAAVIVRSTLTPLMRGGTALLEARVTDPDGGAVILSWKAYACGATLVACQSVGTGTESSFEVPIPVNVEGPPMQRVEHLRVTLEVRDARGAEARPVPEVVLDIGDEPAQISELTILGPRQVGGTLTACVRRGDPDDPPDSVEVAWRVTDAAGRDVALRDAAAPSIDQVCKVFDATAAGSWTVATWPVAAPTFRLSETLVVDVDRPPCLCVLTPAPGAALFEQSRRFTVQRVEDALDPFPAAATGATRFAWSVLAPSRGGARQPLVGATGNYVDLDPATFAIGEVVQLRVEIQDRTQVTPRCPDADATCAATSPGCLQRQTWLLEVR